MAAPTFVATTNTTYASRTNTTVTKPTGTVNGDLVILFFLNGQSGSYGAAPTAPAGFTALPGTPMQVNNGGFYVASRVYYKVASSEGASWAFTHAAITTQAFAVAYRGVDTTTPLDATATLNTGNGTTATWTGLTTATADAMLVALGHDWGDATNNLAPPTGFTERLEVNPLVYAADMVDASPGATGNFTHTVNNLSALPWAAALIALRPTAGSGVTGTLSASTPRATSSATGTVTVSGTLSASTPKATSSVTGTVTVTGTLATSTPKATSAATGAVTVAGTLSSATPRATSTATGSVTVAGSVAAAAPRATSSITGDITGIVSGTLAASTPLATSSATGTVTVTGAMAAATPRATTTIAGTVTITGTLSGTTPDVTGTAAGTVTVSASATMTVPLLVASIAGTAGAGPSLDRNLPYTLTVNGPNLTVELSTPSRDVTVDALQVIVAELTVTMATPILDVEISTPPARTLEVNAPARTLELEP